jgi:hypothetical protein
MPQNLLVMVRFKVTLKRVYLDYKLDGKQLAEFEE